VHVVSLLFAMLPAAFTALVGQAVQVLLWTRSFCAQRIESHHVSGPIAGSPAALVDPAGQATHVLFETSCAEKWP